MDVRESKWKEAAEASDKVLRLDPYEFPAAYYFNAVSNLNLGNLDAAEHSARESAKLEGAQAEPRGYYILGVVLWRRGDLQGAAEKMQTFLAGPSDGPEWESARKMLASIERQIARTQARAGN
jgi:tetratricopeptide (TPR) repeat protein